MKKLMVLVAAIAVALTTFAHGPRGFHGYHGGPRPMIHGGYHHHHHGSWWGRGGRNFWPAFAGGVVGGIVSGGGWCSGGTVVVAPPTTVVAAAPTVYTTAPMPVGASVPITPPVVQTETYYPLDTVVRPVEAYQQVWVQARWIQQVDPTTGAITKTFIPGHYEKVRIQ